MVTASEDKTLFLWDLTARKPLCSFRGHAGYVQDVAALSPDRFVSVSRGSDCRLWHTGSEAAARVWAFDNPGGIAALRPGLFVTGEFNKGDLQFLDPARQTPLPRVQAENADLYKAATVTEDTVLIIGGIAARSTHRLWKVGEDTQQARFEGVTKDCQDTALLSTTRAVSAHEVALRSTTTRAVSAHTGALALWSLPDGALLAQVETPDLYAVRALPTRPGENPRLIVGGNEGYLALWEVRPRIRRLDQERRLSPTTLAETG